MDLKKQGDEIKWNNFRYGSDLELSAIYSEYSKILYHYGLKFTQNQILIEDSIQDLFSVLIRKRDSLGNTDNILFYLMKSFKRILFRQLKKENRYDLKEKDVDYTFDITYSLEHDLILEEHNDERVYLLSQALKKLTPRQKEAIYLKFTRELNYDEVCEMMDMSVEACRNLIYRAVKSLRHSINKDGNGSILFFFLKSLK